MIYEREKSRKAKGNVTKLGWRKKNVQTAIGALELFSGEEDGKDKSEMANKSPAQQQNPEEY